jgi:hypothetical protein
LKVSEICPFPCHWSSETYSVSPAMIWAVWCWEACFVFHEIHIRRWHYNAKYLNLHFLPILGTDVSFIIVI